VKTAEQGRMGERHRARNWPGLSYAVLAVFLFSWSPVLIRLAAPLSAPEITFGRLSVAALALFVLAKIRGIDLTLSRSGWLKLSLYGLVTSLHFLLYIASLSFTTIAHSLSIVYTAPIFTTLLSAWWLRENIPRRSYLGIGVAAAGVAILTGLEPAMSPTMFRGDLLALGSAVCFGFYSVVGRRERDNYDVAKYATYVYGLAAAWLLPAAIIGYSGQQSPQRLLAVMALGIFPLAIGHTLYNIGLRRTHATYVNLVATQEVTGGVLLGYLLLAETPGPQSLLGAGLALLGVALVVGAGTTVSRKTQLEPGHS